MVRWWNASWDVSWVPYNGALWVAEILLYGTNLSHVAVERLRELRVKTLNKLDEDREACYQKTANMYTQEQLNMTIPELEAHLNGE